MKTVIRYPILFRAHPGRTEKPKDVLVPYLHEHDVPEISEAETHIAFRSQKYALVEYDGRLFSKVGKPGSNSAEACFGHAFEKEELRRRPWWIPTIEGDKVYIRYAGQPLDNLAYYRLYLDGGDKARETMIWPALTPDYQRHLGGPRSRNEFTFQGLVDKIRDINGVQFDAGREEHRAEAERLIVIDGSYWIETTPPAICVAHEGRMIVELSHLPNWLDHDLGRQYFPLTAKDEAIEYARRAQAITQRSEEPVRNFADWTDFRFDDNPLFAFDYEGYSLKRTTFLLGGDIARAMTGNGEIEGKIGSARARAVLSAKEGARSCGADYRTWPDASDLVHDVTDAWKMTGRKPGWTEIPPKRHEFGTMICERAAQMADSMPISVSARSTWTTSP
ncbi:hypothetical protein [Rhizobium sp. BK176]|uniref:hypothetical protein n=1 Tax=Rhizobium sp. BK176 TaxID=2587071 RepID=UPI002167D2CC|nr:hypothetical protein [Rhizobium sp. BK176]MCS4089454.1 hypothetical protein [Rhizobium sp. BK176]